MGKRKLNETMTRKLKQWIVDLESFTVEAYTEEEAREEAQRRIREEDAGIDRIFEDEG